MTDLLYGDIEDQLRSSIRDLLGDRADAASVLRRTESGEPYDPALWQTLGRDLGVTALAVDESLGGHGASWREVAVVAEELGRSVAATPFLGSAVLATAAASAAGADELTRTLADASHIGALVVTSDAVPGCEPSVHYRNGVLSGTVRNVVDATAADLLLVPATHDGSDVLVRIDTGATGVRRDAVVSLDLTRPLCDISFDDATAEVVVAAAAARHAVDQALSVGAAMLAAEQLGLAERCLEMTIHHLRTRYQFGRPIGGYQALKHRVADLWSAVTHARAVTRYAAGCVADGDSDAAVAVSVAKAYCSPVAVRAAEECVQLHGGIGFTWEHPAHLYLKRAKADSITLGSAAAHRAQLGQLVGLPPCAS